MGSDWKAIHLNRGCIALSHVLFRCFWIALYTFWNWIANKNKWLMALLFRSNNSYWWGIYSDQSHHKDLVVNILADVLVLTAIYLHGERCTYLNIFLYASEHFCGCKKRNKIDVIYWRNVLWLLQTWSKIAYSLEKIVQKFVIHCLQTYSHLIMIVSFFLWNQVWKQVWNNWKTIDYRTINQPGYGYHLSPELSYSE